MSASGAKTRAGSPAARWGGGEIGPTAVVAAMPEELARLRERAREATPADVPPFEAVLARLEDVPMLLAECGVGKVNAAALTQALLTAGAVRVIMTGVAGALDPRLRVGDLVVATEALHHDVDATALGYAAGQVPGDPPRYAVDPELHAIALAAAQEVADATGVRVVAGPVASGDAFVADAEGARRLWKRFGATCAEMEGAAVAQVCARWAVPFAIVRSISDSADSDAQADFRAFTAEAADRAVAVVGGMLRRLREPVESRPRPRG